MGKHKRKSDDRAEASDPEDADLHKKSKKHKREKKEKKDDDEKALLKAAKKFLKQSVSPGETPLSADSFGSLVLVDRYFHG